MKKFIIIAFIIYLATNFVINGVETYNKFEFDKIYSYSTEELREEFKKEIEVEYKDMPEEKSKQLKELENMTDEQIDAKIKKSTSLLWGTMIIWTLILTLIKNIMPIIIFIVVILTNNRLRKQKLNKDDFFKSKNYYRDILEQKRNVRIIMDR